MASIDLRPGRPRPYRVRYRSPDGASRSRSFARKGEATRFAAEVEASKYAGTYVDPAAGKVTFKRFAAAWLEAQTFDEATRVAVTTRLRVHILPTFGPKEMRSIRPSQIQAWLRGRQESCAPSYVRVMLANLSSICSAAVEDGVIVRNPCASSAVKAPRVGDKKVIPWSHDQVEAVIASLPERYRAVAVVAAGAGLRQGEVFGLRVSDVEFLRRTIHVRQQIRLIGGRPPEPALPKGGKVRDVPLAEILATAINRHLAAFPAEGDDLIFTSREHKPLNRNYFNRNIWKPALKAAGIDPSRGNGLHALRHYYASVLLDRGVSIRALADYLGHADPGFTLRVYAHLMPESEDRARRAVDAAFGEVDDVAVAVL